ncbi:hypothetical protein HYALB_00002725 [Hymenoscyphus albidus]|uniref:Uncharacterized protein n=1 Tax=Hymenoscyphus albidus TaxID=595503 RepID=A0A9N9LYC9_9HELO|nr:hypothetical protein HYALB_00002725 [Hymenoscyphus albidus]
MGRPLQLAELLLGELGLTEFKVSATWIGQDNDAKMRSRVQGSGLVEHRFNEGRLAQAFIEPQVAPACDSVREPGSWRLEPNYGCLFSHGWTGVFEDLDVAFALKV